MSKDVRRKEQKKKSWFFLVRWCYRECSMFFAIYFNILCCSTIFQSLPPQHIVYISICVSFTTSILCTEVRTDSIIQRNKNEYVYVTVSGRKQFRIYYSSSIYSFFFFLVLFCLVSTFSFFIEFDFSNGYASCHCLFGFVSLYFLCCHTVNVE